VRLHAAATQNSTPNSTAYQGSDEPLGALRRQITTSSKTASPGSGTMGNQLPAHPRTVIKEATRRSGKRPPNYKI
jgi:hypothetical protein